MDTRRGYLKAASCPRQNATSSSPSTCAPGTEGDEGRHLLAEGGVGNTHHRRFRHRAVSEERGLDLAGDHGISAAEDQLLLPPHDGDEAGAGDSREVSGPEPSVAHDDAGLLDSARR